VFPKKIRYLLHCNQPPNTLKKIGRAFQFKDKIPKMNVMNMTSPSLIRDDDRRFNGQLRRELKMIAINKKETQHVGCNLGETIP